MYEENIKFKTRRLPDSHILCSRHNRAPPARHPEGNYENAQDGCRRLAHGERHTHHAHETHGTQHATTPHFTYAQDTHKHTQTLDLTPCAPIANKSAPPPCARCCTGRVPPLSVRKLLAPLSVRILSQRHQSATPPLCRSSIGQYGSLDAPPPPSRRRTCGHPGPHPAQHPERAHLPAAPPLPLARCVLARCAGAAPYKWRPTAPLLDFCHSLRMSACVLVGTELYMRLR